MKKIFILVVIYVFLISLISCNNNEAAENTIDTTNIKKENRATIDGSSEPEQDAKRMLELLESFVNKLSESTADNIITNEEGKILGSLFRELDDLSMKYEEGSDEGELFNDYVELHTEKYESLMMKFFQETAVAVDTEGYEKIFE